MTHKNKKSFFERVTEKFRSIKKSVTGLAKKIVDDTKMTVQVVATGQKPNRTLPPLSIAIIVLCFCAMLLLIFDTIRHF